MEKRAYFKDNLILQLTFEFSLEIIEFCDKLDQLRKYRLSNQIMGCGTAIGANVREAQNAESKADFIHKFKVAAKEADEVEYFLLLCRESEHLPNPEGLLEKLASIGKVINKIISTSKGGS